VDTVSKKVRSLNMAAIKSGNTTPEKMVRQLIYKNGYRYKLHKKDLPGKPDIVLTKYKIAIFVNGCFWHHHKGCKKAHFPKSNIKYWKDKINRNVLRDKENYKDLKKLCWNVLIVWQCQLINTATIERKLIKKLESYKKSS
jgi:DNA mismatch endonuclease (patch repair protein)